MQANNFETLSDEYYQSAYTFAPKIVIKNVRKFQNIWKDSF